MGGPGGHNFGTRANNFNFNFDDLFKQFESDIFGDFEPTMRGHFSHHFANHFGAHGEATGQGFDFNDLFQVSQKKLNLQEVNQILFSLWLFVERRSVWVR